MKKRSFLGMILAIVCFFSINFKVEAAFEYKPVAFVLLDCCGNVTKEDFLSWREQVRQAYHVPYYEIIKTSEPTAIAAKIILDSGNPHDKLEQATLKAIAKQIPAEVVVILYVNRMEERLVPSWGFHWDDQGELLEQVIVSSDMYIYKEETDKMLKKKLRYFETEDIPISTPATDVIKYELRKLVNTMENREQI